MAALASACEDGGGDAGGARGNLEVLLEAEGTVRDGVAAGVGLEDIQDGWSASFEKYVVVIGNVNVQLATDASEERRSPELYAVDLTQVPDSGLLLWSLEDLSPVRWTFNYELGGAGPAHGAVAHATATAADFEEMSSNDWTYLIEGELTNPTGRSCPPRASAAPPAGASVVGSDADGNDCYEQSRIGFRLGVPAETAVTRCELDGLPGVAIPDGATATAAITIHGDHMFFNGFPSEDEGSVQRLAQWMADSDLNLDGELAASELEAVILADLTAIDDRYQLGGIEDALETAWDYLIEQLKTQGHMNGEGECLADGAGHEHE